MSEKTVQVTLPDELLDEMDKAVSDGEYASVDQVLQAAADRWSMERWTNSAEGTAFLKKAYDEAMASGPSEAWDLEAFLQQSKLRNKAKAHA